MKVSEHSQAGLGQHDMVVMIILEGALHGTKSKNNEDLSFTAEYAM